MARIVDYPSSTSDSDSDQEHSVRPTNTNFFSIESSDEEPLSAHLLNPFIDAYKLSDAVYGPCDSADPSVCTPLSDVRTSCTSLPCRSRVASIRPSQIEPRSPTRSQSRSLSPVRHGHPFLYSASKSTIKCCSIPKERRQLIKIHSKCVNSLDWRVTETCGPMLLSASSDQYIKVWNVLTEQVVFSRSVHGAATKCARWNRSGNIGSCGYDKNAKITDIEKDVTLCSYQHDNFVNCVVFHPEDDNLLLSGSFDRIDLWDARKKSVRPIRSYQKNFHEVQDIAFLPDKSSFLCCTNLVTRDCADRSIVVWDLATGAVLSNQIFQEMYHSVRLKVHPNGKSFVAQTNGDYLAQFSTIRPFKMNKYWRCEGHKVSGHLVGCDFSPDGSFLISGSADGTIHTYDYYKGITLQVQRVSSPRNPVLSVEWCPNQSSSVALALYDGHIQLWQ